MRLLYNYTIKNISKEKCGLVIDSLKTRVANDPATKSERTQSDTIQNDSIRRFLTTSRPVEVWLQNMEEKVYKMSQKKTPPELWMIIGGYGAGKSHVKEHLLGLPIKGSLQSLELEIATLLASDLGATSAVENVFSLTLLLTRKKMEELYDILSAEKVKKGFSSLLWGSGDSVKENLRRDFDDEFVDVFCHFGELRDGHRGDFKPLQDLIIKRGNQIFLPLMKLYKQYLKINGFCIFIDEFEDLQYLEPVEKRGRFLESIRAFYDTLSKSLENSSLPSFNLIILCSLSFWNDLAKDTRSQALLTRVEKFEIPPLMPDEIIAMGEKIYVLYKRSGYLPPGIKIDFVKLPAYMLKLAKIDEPLTPRFVISQIIKVIEDPENYYAFQRITPD